MRYFQLLLMAIVFLLPLPVRSETPGTMASQAEQAYQKGDFQEAMEKWEDLRALGYVNGDLLYNLGNAAWESGQGGLARWYYLRALKLEPRDERIRNNLSFIDLKLGLLPGEDEADPWVFFKSLPWWKLSLNFYETLQMGALFSLALFGFLLWRRIKEKKGYGWVPWILGIPFIVFTLFLVFQGWSLYFSQKAVVIKKDSLLLSAPSMEAATGQSLPEGSVVTIEKRQGDFNLTQIPQGNSLWMASEALKEIRL